MAYAQPSSTITVTVSMSSTNSGPVDLGSCSNFMILAGSAVTSVGGTINGDVGLSPASGSAIGVTEIQVNGTIYAVDGLGPAGTVVDASLLITAMNDLNNAYNDAAQRTNVDVVDPGFGNIGGMILSPGLYKFTSTASVAGANVTLMGGENDVWIFQIGSTLTVESGIKVILMGGARAKNIFWQVGSSATLGTYSVFKGTILAQSSITMNTGSTIEGRALALTGAVTFNGTAGSRPQEVFGPLAIQINIPTTAESYTSLTNSLNIGGTSSDRIGVTQVTVRNSRDVAGFSCNGIDNWILNGLPLFQGENYLEATAYNALGETVTGRLQITYSGDGQYEDVLRSGNIVQALNFPDNLTPGTIVPITWKVLSYVPVQARVYSGVPNGWTNYQNGVYEGVADSPWNLNGRHAFVYSFSCSWLVPQQATAGVFNVWFNIAQMDGDQFMIAVIPDGADPLNMNDPSYTKLIQRTMLADGDGSLTPDSADTWDSARIFELVDQHKKRSAVTITDINMPDNIQTGTQVTCEWKVQSYVDVKAQLLMVNMATTNILLTNNAIQVGAAVDTSFNFKDRTTGTRYYAKEYTFRSTFTVPTNTGLQQIYFRSKPSADPSSFWMAENLGAKVDARPVLQNNMYGRMIERRIIN